MTPGPYVLRSDQLVPRPLDEVFEFFSRAENLQELTPAWMHFKILSIEPRPVQRGTLIQYSLRWRLIPIRWTTEIVEWEPPHRFVDIQLKGPYSGVTSTDLSPKGIRPAFWTKCNFSSRLGSWEELPTP
jgi:ligand-binding SRPBCC domain-containing protein